MNRLRPALHFCQLNQEPYVIKCWLCCHDTVKYQLLLKLQMKRNPGGCTGIFIFKNLVLASRWSGVMSNFLAKRLENPAWI